MDEYQYNDFSDEETEDTTRVLTLFPGTASDPLTGSLKSLTVSNPKYFEALSYAWGKTTSYESMKCDDKALNVTASLATALRKLRYTDRPRVIWVDQICINQKNLVERSQQVVHMNSIYTKASKIIVWLGIDTGGNAEKAFALITSLAAIKRDKLLLEAFKETQNSEQWFSPEHWNSFGALFKVPWVSNLEHRGVRFVVLTTGAV
jgi:hypothetical protein